MIASSYHEFQYKHKFNGKAGLTCTLLPCQVFGESYTLPRIAESLFGTVINYSSYLDKEEQEGTKTFRVGELLAKMEKGVFLIFTKLPLFSKR